jgi:hypothetical protein
MYRLYIAYFGFNVSAFTLKLPSRTAFSPRVVTLLQKRLIATRSALVEQSTPSFLGLVDEAPVVFNISLDDLAPGS